MNRTFNVISKIGDGYKSVPYDPVYAIAGDTDSVYLDLNDVFSRDADKEDVIKVADYIGEQVNLAIPQFLRDVFNVRPENSSIVLTDREVVSDGAAMLAPKCYAMHVINKEGIDCDKMKIMGLAVKKSDTPKVIQDCMAEIIQMMLKGRSSLEVQKYIDSFREEFYTMSLAQVGIPKSVKALRKYIDLLPSVPDMKGFPGHVKASLVYNSRCSKSDIKIRAGDKVKIVYILGDPDTNSIAIPSDAEVLPDFVSNLRINRTRHWEYAKGKIDTLIVPVGYDQKSRQQNFVNELFGL